MRHLRALFFFLVGVALVALPMLAIAETIPAVTGTVSAVQKYQVCTSLGYVFDSPNAAAEGCVVDAPEGYENQGNYSNSLCTQKVYDVGTSVYYNRLEKATGRVSCMSLATVARIYVCPTGTLSGSSCVNAQTCPTGQNWTYNGTACTRPDCAQGEERDSGTGLCVVSCTSDEERLNGVCLPKCAPTEIRREDGVCRPNCWGAQFYDEVANVCKCSTQQPSTTSWQVSEANAKAGKLDPPSCVNGCEQGVATFGGLAVSFCPGGLATMVIGGSTTCYGKVGQTGATCAPGGSAPGGALIPVSVTPAPAGTGPSGAADPYSTTPNNSDPTSCAAAGGNWGVFNGQGNCYTPTPSDPAVSQSKQQNVVTKQDGSTHITTTTTTNTCTGAGACSSSTTTNTTTNNVSGGGGGGSGGMSVTTNNGAGTATGTVTKTGDGQYKIDLPKDYQKDSTGLILNAIVTDIKDVIGKPTGDDESITGAKASDESAKSVADAQEEVRQLMTGEKNIAEVSEKMTAWDQVMKEGFFEPISISGCSPFSHTFNFFATSYTWNLDHCPTAAKISEIGAYCMWVLLVFSGFRMLTTPRKEG